MRIAKRRLLIASTSAAISFDACTKAVENVPSPRQSATNKPNLDSAENFRSGGYACKPASASVNATRERFTKTVSRVDTTFKVPRCETIRPQQKRRTSVRRIVLQNFCDLGDIYAPFAAVAASDYQDRQVEPPSHSRHTAGQ